MIKRAMQALDGHEQALIGTPEKMNPSIHASLYQGSTVRHEENSLMKIILHLSAFLQIPVIESLNPTKIRPASARRRPSMPNLLDSIPEVVDFHWHY